MYAPYTDAIDWFNENDPFFATLVIALGLPEVSTAVDTAAVSLDSDTQQIQLHMNDSFFEKLTPAECAAVLAHETYHIVLGHLHETADQFPDERSLVLAQESVINDRLANMFYELPGKPIYGTEQIGQDCSRLSTREAYDLYVKSKQQEPSDSEGSEGSSDSGDDSQQTGHSCSANNSDMSPEEREKLANALDKLLADRIAQSDKDEREAAAPQLEEDINSNDSLPDMDSDTIGGSGTSLQGKSVSETIAEANPGKLDWVQLLEEVNPDMSKKPGSVHVKTKTTWARKPKHLGHLPVKLPGREPSDTAGFDTAGRKARLVVALDFSMSIPRTLQYKMAELARMVPEDLIEVKCCTFSTYTVAFDHTASRNNTASGGTNFSPIVRFAKKAFPDAQETPFVVVITDGEARFESTSPTREDLASKWVWVPINSYSAMCMKRQSHFFKKVYSLNLD